MELVTGSITYSIIVTKFICSNNTCHVFCGISLYRYQVLQQTWYVQCLFKMAKGCFFTEDPLVPPRRFFLCGTLETTGVQLGNVFSFSLLACSSLALCLLLHRLLSTCVGGGRVQKPLCECKAFLFHLGLFPQHILLAIYSEIRSTGNKKMDMGAI